MFTEMTPSTDNEELYPLLNMHGEHVQYIDREEANRRLREGVV